MVNQGTLLGRVGRIETKNTEAGLKVCNISMVTSKKYIKNGEKLEKTTWHNVTLFAKIAEIAEKYVGVGDLLYVQGEMDNQKYTAKDGVEKIKSFLLGHELKLMPKSKEHVAKEKEKPKEVTYEDAFGDDEIPF
jgi:single-strand DNA-binding protein